MFGNRLGWGISAVILIFAAFLGHLVYQAARVTAPTGWVQKTIQPLTVPASAQALMSGASEARDAGEFYRRAIDDYLANRSDYDALNSAKDWNAATMAARPGLKALLAATHCATMNLFAASPQEIVLYDSDRPPLDAIHQVGRAAIRVGLLAGTRDAALARRYYEAAFALGQKLFQERIVFDELAKGQELIGASAAGLLSLAQRGKETDRVRAIQQFGTDRLNEYELKIKPVWAVLSSIDQATIGEHAGDLFALAGDGSIERLWRVEATLKLGRLRFFATRRGDQLAAKRVLREMTQDAQLDPAVKIAAEQARDLTIEQYRMLR